MLWNWSNHLRDQRGAKAAQINESTARILTEGALLVLLLFIPSACSRGRDPQTAFDHAEQLLQHGNMDAAEKEAEKGYENFHALSSDWAWKFTILRASALRWEGMNDQVLRVLSSEPGAPSSGDLTVAKQRLEGAAYVSLHKFKEAEQKLAEAERLCESRDYPSCAYVVRTRGSLLMQRGRYDQAQAFFERVLSSARSRGDKFLEANTLLDLSWTAERQTHFDEALDWADEARKISVPSDFADIAQASLGNMGWAYYKLGDPEKALAMFVEAGKQATKLGDTADQVKWLTNAGYIHMDAQEFSVADQLFRESLDLASRINSREDISNSLIALAFVSEQTGKLTDAKRYADEVLSRARADGNKDDENYARLVQGRVAAQQHDTATAEAALSEVAQSPDAVVFLKWEAGHSLARLLADENQPDSADREYKTALSIFEGARANLRKMDSRLPFLTNATSIYDDYIHFLVTRGRKDEALQVADFSRARTLGEGFGPLPQATSFKRYPLNAPEVARRSGGIVLFYWLGEKQSYLWATTPQTTSLFRLPPSSEIDAVVQRYRKAVVGPQDVLETADRDGIALYGMLVAPAQKLLKKDAKVFIIPDGSLNSLNFETLLVPEPKVHYWIEDATVADASSLRLLAASHSGTGKHSGRLLLLGDAVASNIDYPELRNAAAEMDSIEKHFPSSQQAVFTRGQATPTSYLDSKPEQFSYIHFVAHGTASRLSPLDSAIVLSKATAEDDSFKLYARDIIRRPLHAELVTISTCYGAGTRAYSGEGLVGLSWAFLRAGAHNVIGALWEVSDVSTPQLMDQLYGELKKGKSPESALRSAKLSLLTSGSAFRKPFYWAPFQIYTGS